MSKANNTSPSPSRQVRRRNIALALVLAVFAASLAASVFIWRYAHNQPAIPQGGSYGATYQIKE